jgi:adenylate kinase
MGYLEDEVKRLQTVLSSVEGRLKALEDRQFGGKTGKTAEEIRMILIGPPGAGKLLVAAPG